jgi:hypothetical protein
MPAAGIVGQVLENRTAAAARPSPLRTSSVEPPHSQRAKRTNDPLADINLTTARGRRLADLVRAYLRALGNPVEIERQAAVIAAAELQVLAEEARTAALKDAGHADLDRVVRMQGAADRAVFRLGIKARADKAAAPSLRDHLQRLAQQPTGEDGG